MTQPAVSRALAMLEARVGGVPFCRDALISHMIADFQNKHPVISVQQSYGNYAELAAALKADQVDIGIIPVGLTEVDPSFIVTEILPGRNIIACRKHPCRV